MSLSIRIRDLSKRFKSQTVLDRVSLEIAAAERVALIGANGAGKTTLVRCLLGQYRCVGEIRLGGLAPRLQRADVLARVSFVPQLPPPLRMPVGSFLRFAAELCGSETRPMEEVAERLGLQVGAIRGRPFVKLSGGQKQKLLIAVALGRRTDLLLLDEPAANLDPNARKAFFELLEERRGQATMLISSHRLEDVADLVGRVVEMDQGRVTVDDRLEADPVRAAAGSAGRPGPAAPAAARPVREVRR